jgi:hypothetical protein
MYFSYGAGYTAEMAKNAIMKALRGEVVKEQAATDTHKKSPNYTTTLQVTERTQRRQT